MAKGRSTHVQGTDVKAGGDAAECRGRMRLWVEIDGRGTIGPGKLRLLEFIARTHSLVEAAKAMKMSYRHAWKHLKLLEESAGRTLVERRRGGPAGGGTELTPDGRALLDAYAAWRKNMQRELEDSFRKHFAAFCDSPSDAD